MIDEVFEPLAFSTIRQRVDDRLYQTGRSTFTNYDAVLSSTQHNKLPANPSS